MRSAARRQSGAVRQAVRVRAVTRLGVRVGADVLGDGEEVVGIGQSMVGVVELVAVLLPVPDQPTRQRHGVQAGDRMGCGRSRQPAAPSIRAGSARL